MSTEMQTIREPVFYDLKQSLWETVRAQRCAAISQGMAAIAAMLPAACAMQPKNSYDQPPSAQPLASFNSLAAELIRLNQEFYCKPQSEAVFT